MPYVTLRHRAQIPQQPRADFDEWVHVQPSMTVHEDEKDPYVFTGLLDASGDPIVYYHKEPMGFIDFDALRKED